MSIAKLGKKKHVQLNIMILNVGCNLHYFTTRLNLHHVSKHFNTFANIQKFFEIFKKPPYHIESLILDFARAHSNNQ